VDDMRSSVKYETILLTRVDDMSSSQGLSQIMI